MLWVWWRGGADSEGPDWPWTSKPGLAANERERSGPGQSHRGREEVRLSLVGRSLKARVSLNTLTIALAHQMRVQTSFHRSPVFGQ